MSFLLPWNWWGTVEEPPKVLEEKKVEKVEKKEEEQVVVETKGAEGGVVVVEEVKKQESQPQPELAADFETLESVDKENIEPIEKPLPTEIKTETGTVLIQNIDKEKDIETLPATETLTINNTETLPATETETNLAKIFAQVCAQVREKATKETEETELSETYAKVCAQIRAQTQHCNNETEETEETRNMVILQKIQNYIAKQFWTCDGCYLLNKPAKTECISCGATKVSTIQEEEILGIPEAPPLPFREEEVKEETGEKEEEKVKETGEKAYCNEYGTEFNHIPFPEPNQEIFWNWQPTSLCVPIAPPLPHSSPLTLPISVFRNLETETDTISEPAEKTVLIQTTLFGFHGKHGDSDLLQKDLEPLLDQMNQDCDCNVEVITHCRNGFYPCLDVKGKRQSGFNWNVSLVKSNGGGGCGGGGIKKAAQEEQVDRDFEYRYQMEKSIEREYKKIVKESQKKKTHQIQHKLLLLGVGTGAVFATELAFQMEDNLKEENPISGLVLINPTRSPLLNVGGDWLPHIPVILVYTAPHFKLICKEIAKKFKEVNLFESDYTLNPLADPILYEYIKNQWLLVNSA